MEADMATMEKEGMDTGLKVTHPLTGEQVPVWVANYVLMSYGEGAVMAVPAHDERDFGFAKKYQLPIRQSISVKEQTFSNATWREWYADKEHGVCVNSGKYDGLNYEAAVDAIAVDLAAKDLGEKKVQWRLRDWGISRQRYWGCPIPIIHCDTCGSVPVPDDQLPVRLPEDCVPDGFGNPLHKRADFLNCTCPKCGKPAKRETDTMDTFVDSSWYYARYASGFKSDAMVDEETSYWMPVDQYIGGIEHAILHLLYSRFWTKVMRNLGLVKYDEPFANLLTQGMVLNHIYSRRTDKGGIEYFAPEEVELIHDADSKLTGAHALADGQPVDFQGMGTMSKSKRNGVDPQALIEQYGADTARLFMMFASPPEQTLEWADSGVEGAHRFLKRVWAFAFAWHTELNKQRSSLNELKLGTLKLTAEQKDAWREIHLHLKQANYDLSRHQFNTVSSATMKILNVMDSPRVEMTSFGPIVGSGPEADARMNAARKEAQLSRLALINDGLSILLRLLSPICPHITHHLWRHLGYGDNILTAEWPEPLAAALEQDEIELVLQVNGKLRGNLRVAKDASKATLEQLALAHEAVQKHLAGAAPKKIVVVPGRLINIVA
jgi:leucyl-tRNA synthetase